MGMSAECDEEKKEDGLAKEAARLGDLNKVTWRNSGGPLNLFFVTLILMRRYSCHTVGENSHRHSHDHAGHTNHWQLQLKHACRVFQCLVGGQDPDYRALI